MSPGNQNSPQKSSLLFNIVNILIDLNEKFSTRVLRLEFFYIDTHAIEQRSSSIKSHDKGDELRPSD
uniref:Uncharacterized protein n=1 Tax=Romanomermis culicivorax TaxID=13658 RepID=A0A915HI62_ROMCU